MYNNIRRIFKNGTLGYMCWDYTLSDKNTYENIANLVPPPSGDADEVYHSKIRNYDKYQKTPDKSTAFPPSANHPPTTVQPQYKNDNKEKNYKNDKNTEVRLPALGLFKNVFLTQQELDSLKSQYPDDYSDKIERLSRYLASTGKFYRNHYAVLLQWLEQDLPKEPKRKASYDIDELEKINILDDIN